MPKGPRGQKRPADVVVAAVKVAKIATDEIEEETSEVDDKDQAAVSLIDARAPKPGPRGRYKRREGNA